VDDDAQAISAQLTELAQARSTGVLPLSGRCEGAIHFSRGRITSARSQRTPGP